MIGTLEALVTLEAVVTKYRHYSNTTYPGYYGYHVFIVFYNGPIKVAPAENAERVYAGSTL